MFKYDENIPMSLKDFLYKAQEAAEFDIKVDEQRKEWEKYDLHRIVWSKLLECIDIVERMKN